MRKINILQYFKDRVKPYHVKVRNITNNGTITEATSIQTSESLTIKSWDYSHAINLVDGMIGYDAPTFSGTYNGVIFMKNSTSTPTIDNHAQLKVYVDGAETSSFTSGFYNGLTFDDAPADNICNAVNFTSTTSGEVLIIGYYTKVVHVLASTDVIQNDVQIIKFDDNVVFRTRSNSVDVIVSTGINIGFEEGFYNGVSFVAAPIDEICNAIKLDYELYGDADFDVTLRLRFASRVTLSSATLAYFGNETEVAYDWPIDQPTLSPAAPDGFYYEMLIVHNIVDNSVVNSYLNFPPVLDPLLSPVPPPTPITIGFNTIQLP